MPKDIIIDGTDDLLVAGGDFVIGESTQQHQRLLLLSNKGEFKQFPTRCVGIVNYLEDADPQRLAREIDIDFGKDGMNVKQIKIALPSVEVDADYNY